MLISKKESASCVLEAKALAILAYFPFLCIIPILIQKDNVFVLFHGKQGLVIFIAEIAIFILSIIFPWMLILGVFGFLGLSFLGINAVLHGRHVDFPIISDIAEKITL